MITLFENFFLDKYRGKKYWIIINDQYAKHRLFKIGMSLNIINKLKKVDNKKIEKIFIGYDPYKGIQEIDKWSYAQYNYSDDDNLYKNDFEYMGYVDINNNDINNYESEIISKKYNL